MSLKINLFFASLFFVFVSNAQTTIGEIIDSRNVTWVSSSYSITEDSDTSYIFLILDSQSPTIRHGAFGFFGTDNYLFLKNAIDSKFGTNSSFEIPMPTGKLQLEYTVNFVVMTWIQENKQPVVSIKMSKQDCAKLFKKV